MTTIQPQGSRVIKREQLKLNETASPLDGGHSGGCAAPTVRLVRAGGVVRAIRVDCLCGRSMEIECVFDTNSNTTHT